MKRRRRRPGALGGVCGAVAVLLAFVLTAVPAAAQGPGRGPGPIPGQGPVRLQDGAPGRGPVELLLERRGPLALSDVQVAELEAIAAGLRQRNEPLIRELLARRQELRALQGLRPRNMTQGQRELLARHAARARPLMEQVRRNNHRAMEQVGAVLTPAQRVEVRAWLVESGLVPYRSPAEQQRLRLRRGGTQPGLPAEAP
jgi:hypothetical protein